jgi:hypothetical protein
MNTNTKPFIKHCSYCGYELEIHIDNKFNYTTYWCRGHCADHWNK